MDTHLGQLGKVALNVKSEINCENSKNNGRGGVGRERLLELLHRHFGFSSFRGRQLEAIETVLSGKDCFCLMPTGGGKSMCYEIPALAKAGVVLVVSPLIALMIYEELESGRPSLRLLYVTPELIATSGFISKLRKLHSRGLLTLIAIDEAHCISSWGHDFRPSYRKLSALRTHFPSIPILALTATAAKKVQEDVIKSLCLKHPRVLLASFNRPNISYEVYHAGLADKKRSQALEDWTSGKVPVVVATVAFGMGIDRKDVRVVCHYNVPKSLEGFYQESGRAGRDGKPARSVLYYGGEDRQLMEFLARKPEPTQKHQAKEDLENSMQKNIESFAKMVEYCVEARCRRQTILAHFGEHVSPELCAKSVMFASHRVVSWQTWNISPQFPLGVGNLVIPSSSAAMQERWVRIPVNSGTTLMKPLRMIYHVLMKVERRVDALLRAEEASIAKQQSHPQNSQTSNKKNITQAVRDAALSRLKAAVVAASQRLELTRVAAVADSVSIILESECFQKYGKAGKYFYNSKLASTIRWLSTCSSSDLESRVPSTAQQATVDQSAKADGLCLAAKPCSLDEGASGSFSRPSLAHDRATKKAEVMSTAATSRPLLPTKIEVKTISLPSIPSFSDFICKRKQLPHKSLHSRGPAAPFKKPRPAADVKGGNSEL